MKDQEIIQLLRETDQAAAVPEVPSDLAGRVRYRAARRQHHKTAFGLAAAAVVSVALGVGLWRSTNPTNRSEGLTDIYKPERVTAQNNQQNQVSIPGDHQEEIARLHKEVRQLRKEIRVHTALVETLIAREERRVKLAELEQSLPPQVDPLEEIHRQADRAALTIFYQADRKYNELNLKDSAITDYHQVIKWYPQTPWAEQARRRLETLQINQKGDLL